MSGVSSYAPTHPGGFVTLVDEQGDTTYIGQAAAGAAATAPVWRIRKLVSPTSGGLTLQYANGESGYTHVWSDRTTYSYA